MQSLNCPPTNHIKVLDGQGWVGLLDHMGTESTITNAARVSFGKMKETFDEQDSKLLKFLIENQHFTPLEHVSFQFSVHCPLFVRGQWHRHRSWSYNEISRRYTSVDLEFYQPKDFRKQSDSNKQASTDEIVDNPALHEYLKNHIDDSLMLYDTLINNGVCREQARMVLPQCMMTTFWATVDLRNLLHFLDLRDDDHAQKEIREYAKAIKQLIEPYIPHVAEYYRSINKW